MQPTSLDLVDGFGASKCNVSAVAVCSTGVAGNCVMIETSTHDDLILFIQNKSMNNPLNFGK